MHIVQMQQSFEKLHDYARAFSFLSAGISSVLKRRNPYDFSAKGPVAKEINMLLYNHMM